MTLDLSAARSVLCALVWSKSRTRFSFFFFALRHSDVKAFSKLRDGGGLSPGVAGYESGFSFTDDFNADNYYRLKLFSNCYKKWENEYGEIEIYPYTRGYQEFASNDPSFPSNGIPWDGYTFSGRQVVFSDALFNGQEKNIRIDIINEGYEYADCDTISFQFSVFSSDTYSYYNSLDNHREKGPIGIFGGEVIPVYSNVENGLGSIISTNAQIIQIKP